MKEKTDPYSGEKFIPKRLNQKFANRENQIKYNNAKAKNIREEKRKDNFALDNNLKIYKRLLSDSDEIILTKECLKCADFNFNSFTGIVHINKTTYFVTYNYGYTKLKTGKILLKKL